MEMTELVKPSFFFSSARIIYKASPLSLFQLASQAARYTCSVALRASRTAFYMSFYANTRNMTPLVVCR